MELNLDNKSAVIFGLPNSGKSTLANFILTGYGASALIYDTLQEYPDDPFDRYIPKNRADVTEFERVIRRSMTGGKYSLIAVDEANRYCPSKPAPLPQAAADLNDWHAHYDLACLWICRRPVQLNQDLTELASYWFIFNLPGSIDSEYLDRMSYGLGDFVVALPKYHFAMVGPDRKFQLMNPVPREFATAKRIKPKTQSIETLK